MGLLWRLVETCAAPRPAAPPSPEEEATPTGGSPKAARTVHGAEHFQFLVSPTASPPNPSAPLVARTVAADIKVAALPPHQVFL